MKSLKLLTFIIIFLIFSCEDSYYIKIGDKTFPFELKDTSAANELKAKLPFKVEMTKLNGNEIYYQFSEQFTTNTKSVGTINTGDIYLYQNNYLVLFYKTFTTSYTYSEIGKLTDTNGLEEAIGDGSSIEVEWCININSQESNSINESTDKETDKETDDDEQFTNFTKTNFSSYFQVKYFIIFILIFILYS